MTVLKNIAKLRRYNTQYGLRNTVRRIMGQLLNRSEASSTSFLGKDDIIASYAQYLGYPHGDAVNLANAENSSFQWVIPNFSSGSGGHLNIFRFIRMLETRGFKQHIVIVGHHNWSSREAAKKAIEKWYFPVNATLGFGYQDFQPSEFTIATGWQTAYWVHHYKATKDKYYFVQDFEPYFHPVSTEYVIAENTYRLGLKGITAGNWLSKKLTTHYGMECFDLSFSFDKYHYLPTPKRENPNFNILFYSRHVTPRRLFGIGLLALEKLCEKYDDIAVIFAGGDVSGFKIPFHHLNAGELSLDELPDLYSQCDLSLVLSGTNLSLLPLELAACKCPTVMNNSPSARWLLPDNAAFYADMEPSALRRVLEKAYLNEKLRNETAMRAYNFAQTTSWEAQVDKLLQYMGINS